MKEYLSLLIDATEFEDNARPGFLVNPLTDHRLELDRYYDKLGVAFEFQGPQHDGEETDFATTGETHMQRVRDLIKLGLCTEWNIKVVFIRAKDLKLETIQAKIGDLLPKRDLAGHEPLIAVLESISRHARKPHKTKRPRPQ